MSKDSKLAKRLARVKQNTSFVLDLRQREKEPETKRDFNGFFSFKKLLKSKESSRSIPTKQKKRSLALFKSNALTSKTKPYKIRDSQVGILQLIFSPLLKKKKQRTSFTSFKLLPKALRRSQRKLYKERLKFSKSLASFYTLQKNQLKEKKESLKFEKVFSRAKQGPIKTKDLAKSLNLSSRDLRDLELASGLNLLNSKKKSSIPALFKFALILLIIIVPFKLLANLKGINIFNLKDRVFSLSNSALDNLKTAASGVYELDFVLAADNFSQAELEFNLAQIELAKLDSWVFSLASLSRNKDLKLAAFGPELLRAAELASSLAHQLSLAGEIFTQTEDKNWATLIDSFLALGVEAQRSSYELESILKTIKVSKLPLEHQANFNLLKDEITKLNKSLDILLRSGQEIKEFLGLSKDKRYLLVFQNNAEMRASGGFLGSYALLDIRDGKIRNLELPAGGSYDTEAGMRQFIKSPEPLHLISPRWYFWDANWWPDWPSTAKNLMWFYEKSDGPSVDGVISFTPDVLSDLLKIIGEIELGEEYNNLVIDSENFWDLIQRTVEKPNLISTHPDFVADVPDSPLNQPKKILGDLMFKIVDLVPGSLNADNINFFLEALEKNLLAKNILLYFSDPKLEEKIQKFGLAAEQKHSEQDYLMIVHTNIAGQKTDRKINETINHHAEVLSDFSIVDTLEIIREHKANKGEALSGVRNVNWMRIYLPLGSELISAEGFSAPDQKYFKEAEDYLEDLDIIKETENLAKIDPYTGVKIYQENSKTVFAHWQMIDPGETGVIRIKYRLPFKLKPEDPEEDLSKGSAFDKLMQAIFSPQDSELLPYHLIVQKQAGAKPSEINFSFSANFPNTELWSWPKPLYNGKDLLDQDLIRAVVLDLP